MKKSIIASTLALAFVALPALAQTYYPTSSACVAIPAGLGIGARGMNVTQLQQFLVAQNYPGGGSWMMTGYYGRATAAAVRNYQSQHGLSQSGMIDVATASSMSASCSGTNYSYSNYNQNYQTISTTYPSTYSYPSYLNNNYYGGAPAITSLSQNTGTPGQSVTIYGVGFDAYNNIVNFGGTALYNVPSNGSSLTFTIPANGSAYSLSGTVVQLSVQNSRGTSGSVGFTVWGSPYVCNGYGNYGYNTNNCGGCTNGQNYNSYPYNYGYNSNQYNSNSYNSCPPQQGGNPTISYLSPSSGPVGTTVTVYGSGFSLNNNTVHFGPGIISNLLSSDGRSVTFQVPPSLTGFGNQPITLTTYQVSVTNAVGVTSNAVPFAVTSLSQGGQPTITSVTGPNTLAIGQQGTWSFIVNAPSNQYLTVSASWGDQNVYGTSAAAAQTQYYANQSVSLTHTYYQAGTYSIVFTVWNGNQSNTYTTTVTVGAGGTVNPGNATVSIFNMAFNPQTITVHAGTTVVWTNNDSMQHTVTSDSNLFNSGGINPGQSFSFTFTQLGTFTYHCAIHPNMTGTVVVIQ